MKAVKIGLCLATIAAIVCLGLYLAPSKTVDFSGEVTAVSHEGDRVVLTVTLDFSDIPVVYTVPADGRTRTFYYERDDKITPEEIRVGDRVSGNYRWRKSGNAARYIQVMRSAE